MPKFIKRGQYLKWLYDDSLQIPERTRYRYNASKRLNKLLEPVIEDSEMYSNEQNDTLELAYQNPTELFYNYQEEIPSIEVNNFNNN